MILVKRSLGNPAITTLCVLWSFLNFAQATDWPQWRGPERDGVSSETNLLDHWPEAGPPLVWQAQGIGAGYSGVSIADSRVFTLGEAGEASYVFALDESTGRMLWLAKAGRSGTPGWGDYSGPRSTPTVSGDLVFALSHYGELVCLRTLDGSEVWRRHLEEDWEGKRPEWGFSESPLVDGGKLVVTPGGPQGAIAALDKTSGALIWQSREITDEAQYGSLVATEFNGVRQYILSTLNGVAGIAAEDGRLLWQAKRKAHTAVIPTPIVAEGRVYVTCGYGVGSHLFQITEQAGGFSANLIYASKAMVNHHGGVVKVGNYLYGYSEGKGWVCQDFLTGQMKWNEKQSLRKGSLTCADGHLYCREESGQGTVALLQASPDGYREVSRFVPPNRNLKKSWPHPVIANGKLYLRDQDLLLAYSLERE